MYLCWFAGIDRIGLARQYLDRPILYKVDDGIEEFYLIRSRTDMWIINDFFGLKYNYKQNISVYPESAHNQWNLWAVRRGRPAWAKNVHSDHTPQTASAKSLHSSPLIQLFPNTSVRIKMKPSFALSSFTYWALYCVSLQFCDYLCFIVMFE